MSVLRKFEPVLTTDRVRTEQFRTAPLHAQEAFRKAHRDGWVRLVAPASQAHIEKVLSEAPALSSTDAELFVLAHAVGEDLFTDEALLARYSAAHGLTVYDVVDTLLLLEELGSINAEGKKRLVFSIHAEDGRIFTPSELDALGLPGFL